MTAETSASSPGGHPGVEALSPSTPPQGTTGIAAPHSQPLLRPEFWPEGISTCLPPQETSSPSRGYALCPLLPSQPQASASEPSSPILSACPISCTNQPSPGSGHSGPIPRPKGLSTLSPSWSPAESLSPSPGLGTHHAGQRPSGESPELPDGCRGHFEPPRGFSALWPPLLAPDTGAGPAGRPLLLAGTVGAGSSSGRGQRRAALEGMARVTGSRASCC